MIEVHGAKRYELYVGNTRMRDCTHDNSVYDGSSERMMSKVILVQKSAEKLSLSFGLSSVCLFVCLLKCHV